VSRVVETFTFDCAEQLVGGFGPGERLGALVAAVDVGADRGLQVSDVGVGAAADGLAGDDAEEVGFPRVYPCTLELICAPPCARSG
jgi:hypothetical protein